MVLTTQGDGLRSKLKGFAFHSIKSLDNIILFCPFREEIPFFKACYNRIIWAFTEKGGEKHKSPPVKLVKILKLFILQKKCQLMRHEVRARGILTYNQNGHGLNVDSHTILLKIFVVFFSFSRIMSGKRTIVAYV